jgi:hypothetical protein
LVEFIEVTQTEYGGHSARNIFVRADLILQMQPTKDSGTWLILERIGWLKVTQTPAEIKDLIATSREPPKEVS